MKSWRMVYGMVTNSGCLHREPAAKIGTAASHREAEHEAEDEDHLGEDQVTNTAELSGDNGCLGLIGLLVLEDFDKSPDQETKTYDEADDKAKITSTVGHVTTYQEHKIVKKRKVIYLRCRDGETKNSGAVS